MNPIEELRSKIKLLIPMSYVQLSYVNRALNTIERDYVVIPKKDLEDRDAKIFLGGAVIALDVLAERDEPVYFREVVEAVGGDIKKEIMENGLDETKKFLREEFPRERLLGQRKEDP